MPLKVTKAQAKRLEKNLSKGGHAQEKVMSWLYENLEVKPCNILGYLHFEVCAGNVTLAAFAYEKDALLFKNAAQQSVEPPEDGLRWCGKCNMWRHFDADMKCRACRTTTRR